jgi:hypothetical protein
MYLFDHRGAAETATGNFRAMRIDRAMADSAVKQGRRILVAAALESTLAPTLELLRGSAGSIGPDVQLAPLLVKDEWKCFETGEREDYISAVADAIQAGSDGFDVVVLAQASMAPVAGRCGNIGIPILSSPRIGVETAVKEIFA